ncbi:hypothetical protein ACHAWF_014176 [Thalassiosira exigua]
MGKGKRKRKSRDGGRSRHDSGAGDGDGDGGGRVGEAKDEGNGEGSAVGGNPLLTAQRTFLSSLSPRTRADFFSPSLAPSTRAEIWERQASRGEELVNECAWATPDARCLRALKHFGPIVEVGCGANAYWARWMARGGVDVLALDVSLDEGGKISDSGGEKRKEKKKRNGQRKDRETIENLTVRRGGPEDLAGVADRTLFLCYPDEEDLPQNDREGDDDEEGDSDPPPQSMAASCLEHYSGSTVVHVGELYGDSLSTEQSPFGRSSSPEFQCRLASEFHCVLKMRLQNWLHVRDTLSVWKRSETCCIAFRDEGDDDDVEEAHYKYVPPDEVLPVDAAAPCVAHLLESSEAPKPPPEIGKENDAKKVDPSPPKKDEWEEDEEEGGESAVPGEAW